MKTRRDWIKHTSTAALAWSLRPVLIAAEPKPASPRPASADTLKDAMERCGQCHVAWLDSKRHWLPMGGYEVSHDTGRWWDALLRLEAATGFKISSAAEAGMLEVFRVLTDNPGGLLANDERFAELKGTAQANPHNFRESTLAYSALVRYRNHEWSRRQGKRLVETTAALLEPDGQMDYQGLAKLMKLRLNEDISMIQKSPAGQWFDATGSTGRALEGFLRFYEATQDETVLALAKRLAEVHYRNLIQLDGKIPLALLAPR